MRFTFTSFLVSISTVSVLVFAQNKDFCQSFVDNNYEFDGVFTEARVSGGVRKRTVFIIGRDYWVNNNYSDFETRSQRLPDWFDNQCLTFFCYEYCDIREADRWVALKYSIHIFVHMFVKYNEFIDFRREVIRKALMSSNGRQLICILMKRVHTFCTDLRSTHFRKMNPKSNSKRALNPR